MNPPIPAPEGTVMIVDDAPGNLALLSDALEEAGYRVLVATDGLSALEQLAYIKPDVILLDAVMPGLDGFETCRRLKADPATQAIPVLFMTALSELDDLLRGFGEGAVDYIVKPVRHQEVLARVAAQLAQTRAVRRAEEALARSGLATVVIDAEARIVWMTPNAREWPAEWANETEIGAAVGGPLPEMLAVWAMRAIAGGKPEETFGFERDGRKFSARLSPSGVAGEFLLLLQERGGWNMDALRQALGLTMREAEILMWIARGKTNRDVGLILGNSPRTVNKHLEHIFEKLGVATRAAAIAVVLDRG